MEGRRGEGRRGEEREGEERREEKGSGIGSIEILSDGELLWIVHTLVPLYLQCGAELWMNYIELGSNKLEKK